MRKPHIATRLNGGEYRILAVGQVALEKYKDKPLVLRSVIQVIRNVATQDEQAALEVKESFLFEQLEQMIVDHEADGKWRSPVEIAKQFLGEFRADKNLQKAAEFNEFY